MNAFVFDLGDTLVEYEGLPLSWVDHYPQALHRLASLLRHVPDSAQIDSACSVLRGYNTRLHPRQNEVSFAHILNDICECFSVPPVEDREGAARAFFSAFRQRLRCFPDSQSALTALRSRGVKIGVFTDVPYGMPRSLVIEDVRQSGLAELIDHMVTSDEVGVRKPARATIASVASRLNCGPSEIAHVGNERKDVDAANAFGCAAILVDRSGRCPAWGQDRTITSLTELLLDQ